MTDRITDDLEVADNAIRDESVAIRIHVEGDTVFAPRLRAAIAMIPNRTTPLPLASEMDASEG